MRKETVLSYFLEMRETGLPIKDLHPVVCVPVARYQHPPVVQFYCCCACPLLVETAETLKTVAGGVVHLDFIAVADAKIVLETAGKKHFSRPKHHAKASVMGVDGME